jgi:putative membrane protein
MATQQQTLNSDDQQFALQAAWAGMAEIRLSQLVRDRAGTDEIREFGQHMIHDHTEANEELRQLVTRKGIQVSEELDREHTDAMNRLSGLRGKDFDREYIDVMVRDHRKVIAEFEREAQQGGDEELKRWAGMTLPKLQRHLEMAEDIARRH